MKTIVVLLLLGISNAALSQEPVFDRAFSLGTTSYPDYCHALYCTDNTVTAVIHSFHLSSVVRLTTKGDTLWTRQAPGPGRIKYIGEKNGFLYAAIGGPHYPRIVKWDVAGNLLWDRNMEPVSTSSSAVTTGLAVLSDGSVVIAGYMKGKYDFDPLSGSHYHASYTLSVDDAFLWKLDTDGNFEWVKTLGGPNNDAATGLETDAQDNLYVTGNFYGQAQFGNQWLNSEDFTNGFVSKLASNGNLRWVKQVGGAAVTLVDNLAVTPEGDVYCSGNYEGTVDLDPGSGTNAFTSGGFNSDMFITRLDKDGNHVWGRVFEGRDGLWCSDLILDRTGQVVMTGALNDTADLDPGVGVFTVTSPAFTYVSFALKLSIHGTLRWCISFEGEGFASSPIGSYDHRDGLYLSMGFDTLDCDPGSKEHLLFSRDGADACMIRLNDHGSMSPLGSNEELPGIPAMELYPNPSSGHFTLVFPGAGERRVEVFDLSGKSITSFDTHDASHAVELNRPAGLYFLRVSGEGENATGKFVIE